MKTFAPQQKSLAPVANHKPQTVFGSNRSSLLSPNAKTLADLSRPLVQPKLTINQPGDQYEQEADRVAEEVMRSSSLFGGAISAGGSPNVQKKCAACASGGGLCPKCAEEEKMVQRKPISSSITPLVQAEAARLSTP